MGLAGEPPGGPLAHRWGSSAAPPTFPGVSPRQPCRGGAGHFVSLCVCVCVVFKNCSNITYCEMYHLNRF